MNDTNTNRRLSPQRAIIVYRDNKTYNHSYYLESREIKNDAGKYILMAPVALASNVMTDIAKSYMKSNVIDIGFGGLISNHLLYVANKTGLTVVMWYREAMRRNLNFSASLKIKGNSNVQIPATLYLVMNNKLYIFAMMSSGRPDLKTKLYNAPYFNIYEDGNVCLGTARIGQRARTYEGEADRFERAFYMAEQNGGQTKDKCKTPLPKLWTQLIKNKIPFPSKKELVQHKKFKTIGDLLQKLIGSNTKNNEDDFED